MKKTIIIAILMFLFMLNTVLSATLIDSEDFEAYNTGDTTGMFDTSGGKWNCTVLGEYPSCKSNAFGGGAGNFKYIIETDGSNEYLRMYAVNGSNAGGGYRVRLTWNSSNGAVQAESNHTFSYRLKLNLFNMYDIAGGNSNKVFFRESMNFETTDLFSIIGGLTSTNTTDQQKFRIIHTGGQYAGTPCNITDNAWHDYVVYYITNGTHVNRKELYKDGSLCVYNDSVSYGDPFFPFDYSVFEVWSGVDVSIDDLAYYQGIAETNLTLDECNDGIDNDGDNFTDYPDDPHCFSITDDTEAPYDYVHCNNGIDDDLDGFIDYPDDPSCANPTDTSEFPVDASIQPENECLTEEFCLLREQFPYSDNISLHGWEGLISDFRVVEVYGSNRLYFDNDINDSFNLLLNTTNPNIYNEVEIWYSLYHEIGEEWADFNNYTYYLNIKDDSGNTVIRLKYDYQRDIANVDRINVHVSTYNSTGWTLMESFMAGEGSNSRARYTLTVDQITKTFRFDYFTSTDSAIGTTDYTYANSSALKVNSIGFEQLNYNNDRMTTYMDNIVIYGSDVSFDTVCDTWQVPYYLVESFNGYPVVCDWVSNLNLFFSGQMYLTQATTLYYIQKDLDLIKDENTRYASLEYDMSVINVTIGSTITIRLYDDEGTNFLTTYYRDTGNYLWYNEDGTGRVAKQINLNEFYNYKFVMDLDNDEFDIYVNDLSVVNDSEFGDSFLNLESIQTIKITSNNAEFRLDNVTVFSSDENGNPLIPDIDIAPAVENETTMCGLFYRTTHECSEDADCATGDCMVNGKCNTFDMNYCDGKGYTRGSKCIFAGMSSCVLESTKDLILDNFLLFLVFLVIMVLAGYLVVFLRQK